MADIAGLRLFLRDSDDVKASIQVLSIPDSQDTSTSDTQLINAVSPTFKTILSVISHKDSVDQHEEGSVFVLREKSPSQTLEIERLIPVCGDFSVSITQMRLDSSSQDRAGFRITVSPGHPDDPLSFFTRDAEGLQIVLAECRRLKDLSEYFIPASPSQTYSWLTSYNSEHTIPTITTVPPDIRFAQQPIHRRLSPASAGTPGDDTHDLHLLRDEWVRSRAREQTRDGSASLDIRIGTFNVNGQPPTQDLASWVRGKSPVGNGFIPPLNDVSPFTAEIDDKDPLESQSTITSEPPYSPSNGLADVFVFAFQELDLSTEALIYATSTAKEDVWCTAIFASLGEHQSFYTKLASKQLVGMLIVIIVRKSLAHRFGDVKTCAAGVGMMGMGNKGGTAVQVTYKPADGYDVDAAGGTVITFVNSHLAAFDEMVERRNSDFNDLSKRLVFSGGDGESSADIWETDVLFWVGDLNYRLDQPDADVRELLLDANEHNWAKKRNMDALTEYDQLKSSMRSGKAFQDFCEFDISHMPSYRFSPGILVDSLGYDLKRKPAWTDRILHLQSPAVKLRQHSYTVYPHITMSDHKPVSADFTLEVDVYDEQTRLAASRKLYRQLEGLERESKRLIVEPDEVKVGEIRYKQTVVRQLTLRNDGKTPCAFRFVSPIEGGAIHPPWLAIEPLAGIVMPNQPFEITMSVCVDEKTPYFSRELDCTLVLHAGPGLGKDRFVVVQGDYQMSCAGVPLTKLVQLPGPIRTTYEDKSAKHDLNAPREVMRLVNWMMDHRLADAFHGESDGDANAGKVRECLDTGADFPEGLPSQAYGAVLLEFLLGIVPKDVKVDGVHNREEAFEVLDSFPIVNVNVWISVTAFLHYIVHGSPERVNEIAAVLAPVVLSEVTASIMEKRRFVRYFIDLE